MTDSEDDFFRAKGFVSGCERGSFGLRKGSFGMAKGFVSHSERGSFAGKGSENEDFCIFIPFLNNNYRVATHRMVKKV